MRNDKEMKVFTDANQEGFALGGNAKVVPQQYVDQYNQGLLKESYLSDYSRVINRLSQGALKNSRPAHVRVTQAGSLILF